MFKNLCLNNLFVVCSKEVSKTYVYSILLFHYHLFSFIQNIFFLWLGDTRYHNQHTSFMLLIISEKCFNIVVDSKWLNNWSSSKWMEGYSILMVVGNTEWIFGRYNLCSTNSQLQEMFHHPFFLKSNFIWFWTLILVSSLEIPSTIIVPPFPFSHLSLLPIAASKNSRDLMKTLKVPLVLTSLWLPWMSSSASAAIFALLLGIEIFLRTWSRHTRVPCSYFSISYPLLLSVWVPQACMALCLLPFEKSFQLSSPSL